MKRGKKQQDILAKLTPQQAQYVEGVIDGKTKMQAALDAGYAHSSAVAALSSIEKPKVRDAFQALMREAVPAEKIIKRIAEGLDAEETVFAKFEGRLTDKANVIAWNERREYAKLAAEYGGFFVPQKPEAVVPANLNIQVVVEHMGNKAEKHELPRGQ